MGVRAGRRRGTKIPAGILECTRSEKRTRSRPDLSIAASMIHSVRLLRLPPMKRPLASSSICLLALFASACSSISGSGGSGGDSAKVPEFRPISGGDAVFVWSGGIDALLVDAKDAGVRDALHRMGERLLELPAELEEPEFPAEAIDFATAAFMGPMSLSIGPAEDPGADGMPVRAQMNFHSATPEEARIRAERLTKVMSDFGAPSLGVDEADGLSKLDFGVVQVVHGIALAGRADTVVVGANGLQFTERDLGTLDLPEGVKPALAYRFDYRTFGEMLEMFGGPEASEALRSAGMGDVIVQGGMGHGSDRTYASMRTMDWVPAARESGGLPHGSIPRAAFAAIPSDATIVSIARTDIAGTFRTLTSAGALAGEGVDPFAFVRELTGLDVEQDVIANLGETMGAYLSDSTGGGGWFSTILFAEVAREAELRAALERLEGRLEDLAAENDIPGLMFRHSQHAGTDITTATVSGWPIPIEPSWAIRGGWFFASTSAQGLRAALDQAANPRSDLLDNEKFSDAASGSMDDLLSVTFVDVPRFARDGYPIATMIGAVMSNGVSSLGDPDRVPVGIVPTFAQFTQGTRALLALGRLDGDDMVIRSSGDSSMLVQAVGLAGAVGPLPMMLIGAGAAFGSSDEDETFEFEIMEDAEDPGMDGAMDEDMDDMGDLENNLGIDTSDLVTDPAPQQPIDQEPK